MASEQIDWSALAHELGTICGPDEVGTEIGGAETAREAIERLIGPARLAGAVLPWIPEFLADPDPGIQAWAIGILDQLVFSRLVEEEECASILEGALNHSNPHVQEMATDIRERLTKGA